MKPFYYQKEVIDKTLADKKSKVIVLPTGAGKTITACFLILEWLKNNTNSRVLITCHRIELVEQFMESLLEVGISCESITAKKRKYKHDSIVYVSMVETLNNKLQNDENFLSNIGLIISDECHVMVHEKVYSNFPNAFILGLTATPSLEEREAFFICQICNTEHTLCCECCGEETMEYARQRTLSSIYDDIVLGITIEELIEIGQLVKEINFTIDVDLSELVTDNKGEFTNNSLSSVYSSQEAVYDVVRNYEEIALGKRTMVFNANTKVNKEVYEMFLEKGYNVRMFDSINTPSLNRKELVKWYAENDDAILCNVASFVAGFDNREIECVILNMATQSLSKYIQCVGRGGRSSKKIYKDSFIVIDLGGNVNRFGSWSEFDKNYDLRDLFFNGQIKPKAKQENIELVKECSSCGALNPRYELTCEYCGFKPEFHLGSVEKIMMNDIAKIKEKPKPPSANKIIEYTKSKGENLGFAYKVFFNQLVDLFRYSQMSISDYEKFKNNGKLEQRIREICRPAYFVFMRSDLEYGNNTKLETFISKGLKKIEKHYEKKIRK